LLDHARTRTTCIKVSEFFSYRLYTYVTLLLDVSLAHSNAREQDRTRGDFDFRL